MIRFLRDNPLRWAVALYRLRAASGWVALCMLLAVAL